MNGEMYQICRITAAAKNALKTGASIQYEPVPYEKCIGFQFLPEKKLFGTKQVNAKGVEEWYVHCCKKGMRDIKMMLPIQVKDRNVLGFSNTSQSALVCFWGNSQVSLFFPRWEFDSAQKGWDIRYTEQVCKDLSGMKFHFGDNTEDFKAILEKIGRFAREIDCGNFADIFETSLSYLQGASLPEHRTGQIPLPQIPESHLPLFQAASRADVFGAMGSWNDSPPYMAHEKGMDEEYGTLSDGLLRQLRLAVLYTVNGW